MKNSRAWEDIFDDGHVSCYRVKVRGGWYVVFWVRHLKSEHSVFVPDPNHEWKLKGNK
ncbi:MAG: hypothetical protein HYZ83_05180 [Candidatus Omnitrophica bacterium]|nr:hypothetical protein [Candidatus Omnitrophota bacterium]